MEKEYLKKLANDGLSIRQIGLITEKTYTTVRYWLDKHKIKTDGYNKNYNWSEERLRAAILISECKSDVLRNLGISTKSGNFQTLERYLKKYNINPENLVYDYKRGNKWSETKTDNEIFCENSSVSKNTLKNRILKNDLLEYKCQECGIKNEWNGKKIQLQLDHKNGKNDDNRIENLRYLCPNCHSQTETYCMGNKKKVR
jgi:Zn finger protein HypA/HybF involved in hydrogenase expression